jgi:teichuronic acid biosynthesis glycosyltransferase TuaG
MKVSIVMPTHGQGDHILDALTSIEAQAFTDFELIVVCDGPPDEGTEVALELRTPDDLIVLSENKGTAEALNAGFARARGELFTWVSSDNEMDIEWLEVLVEELEGNDDADCVYSGYFREEGEFDGKAWRPRDRRKHFVDIAAAPLIDDVNCAIGPSFLYDRQFHQEHRGKISHDYDNWLRFEEAGGKIVGIPRPLCVYRVHDERVTITRREQYDAEHWQAEARKRRGLA